MTASLAGGQPSPAVVLVAPANGRSVDRGETIDVDVHVVGADVGSSVVVAADAVDGSPSLPATPNVRIPVTIRQDARYGAFEARVVLALGSGGFVASAPLTLVVRGPAATALQVDSQRAFSFAGDSRGLRVWATTPSGLERLPSSLIAFTTGNPAVATVSSLGVVTARGTGTTVLTARYPQPGGDVVASTSIVVAGGVSGDLDGDGVVTAADREFLSLVLGQPATGSNDARDLNHDGVIDQQDVDVVQATCTPSCQPPLGAADTYSVASGATLNVQVPGVLANDVANGAAVITAYVVSLPANGALSLRADGSFTYTPSPGFSGSDSFRYRPTTLSGGAGAEVPVSVTVTPPPPPPPVAANDVYSTAFNAPLSITAPGVLANDHANGGAGLSAVLSSAATAGTVALSSSGGFVYTPLSGFSGLVTFQYRAQTTNGGQSAPATVSITVAPNVPPPPVAFNDSYSTPLNMPLNVSAPGVLANDAANSGTGLSAVLSTAPAQGNVSLNANGSFVYTPPTAFAGVATFQYRAQTTNGGQSTPATVSIAVGSGQPPTGVDDAYLSAAGADLNIAAPGVLANDNANGAGPLTSQVVTTPLHGTLTLGANGSFLYRPAPGYAGLDSFTYRPSSAFGPGTLATVRITLSTTPVPPTSVADSYDVAVNGTLTVPAPGVLANDLANGGGPLLADASRAPRNGTLTLGSNGAVTYRPTAGFSGLDTFTYRARTAAGGTGNEATVTVRVQTTVPQPPTDFRVARVDGRDVTFVWTAPGTGPTPFGYQLEGGLAPGQTLGVIPAGTGEAVKLTLPVGAFYVRLRTLTLSGLSAPSPDLAIQVGLANPPSAPAGLLGMVSGGRLGLAWTPTFDGGTPTNAVLDVTGAFTGSLSLGSADRFEFPLVPPGQYTFTVRQTNAVGASVASNAVTLTFPGGCSGVPAAPVRLRTIQGGGRVTVFWDPPPDGAAPSSYLLSVSGGLNATIPMGERTVSAPVPPGTYTLTIAGANACGTGPASVAHTFTVS